MGRSLGCDIIDSGIAPNKNSPFNGNMQLYDTIANSKCTTYPKSDITGNISQADWLTPTKPSGALVPNNICFENASFFGSQASNNSPEASFATAYCNNVADENSYIQFQFPQDSNFREIFYNGNNVPEWGNPTQVAYTQNSWNQFENAAAGGAIGGLTLGGGITTITRGLVKGALSGIKAVVRSAFKTGTTTASTEAGTETAGTTLATGEEVVTDAAIEAGSEAFASTAVEVTTDVAIAGLDTPAAPLAVAILIGVVVAGFIDDLEHVKCSYDDLQPPTLVANRLVGACCRGHCAIAGKLTSCFRNGAVGFNASFFKCCLDDFECNGNNENCFNTKEGTPTEQPSITTCHPSARNLSSNMCSTVVGSYCMGETPFATNQSQLLDAWSANGTMEFENEAGQVFSKQSPCLNLVARLLTGGTTFSSNICTWQDFISANLQLSPEVLNPVGLTIVQEILETVLANYLNTHGSPFGKINQDAYIENSDFITWFFGLCKAYPFLCQNSLSSFCANLTPDDLLAEPSAIKWCGCYLQDQYYEKYNIFNISKQCTPLCNIDTNIPLIGDDGDVIPCTETVCMIDDLSINLANTFTQGGINFSQVCNSCGQSQIVKKYSSNYSYEDSTNISQFFQITSLNNDEFSKVKNAYNTEVDLPGYEKSNSTYLFSANQEYTIVQQSNNMSYSGVKFVLGVPIVIPSSNYLIYYLESFTQDTVTLLNNANFGNGLNPANTLNSNIFKILMPNGDTLPGANNKDFYIKVLYYKTGKTTVNGNDTISQSFAQNIYSDVSQYNVGIINKNCTCTISGDFNFVNEQISNLDINNNCGNTTCTDANGNRTPCGTNSINLDNKSSIINSVSDNVDGFNMLTVNQKTEFVSTSTMSLFFVLIAVKIFLTIYPNKYHIIFTVAFFIFIIIVVVIYFIYSNSFDLSNFGNIFQAI